jgi:hypothetical protein
MPNKPGDNQIDLPGADQPTESGVELDEWVAVTTSAKAAMTDDLLEELGTGGGISAEFGLVGLLPALLEDADVVPPARQEAVLSEFVDRLGAPIDTDSLRTERRALDAVPLAELSALVLELGMPIGARWIRLIFEGSATEDFFEGYRRKYAAIEFIGSVADTLPPPGTRWFVMSVDPGGEGTARLVLQLWRMRLFVKSSPVFGEMLWHPERGMKTTIKGLEHPHAKMDVDRAWQGLFHSYVRLGRRRGSYKIPNFRERLSAVYRRWIDERDERPAQEDIAAELGISRSTLNRQLRIHDIAWPLETNLHF